MKKSSKIMMLVVIIASAAAVGLFYVNRHSTMPNMSQETVAAEPKVLYWYDPMKPEQHFDKPGKSPFMDMDLMPKYADSTGAGTPSGIQIDAAMAQNLAIRLAKVQKKSFVDSFNAVGRLEFDEHGMYAIQTRSAGFVEKLRVRAVGDTVRVGQKVADIYMPELLAAQQEYLTLVGLTNVPQIASLRQAARQRLQLLGMATEEINGIPHTGRANARVGVYAPASGVVTALTVREGAQLAPNTTLMQLADLTHMWLLLDIPEQQAAGVNIGDSVNVSINSVAVKPFKGRVDYLYPELDPVTRSLRTRVVIANPTGQLKVGMFATADLQHKPREVLTIPSEAIINTGTRSVVIVKEAQGFRPAVVSIGAEKEGDSEVLEGLEEGEEVVSSGQFLIDSEASLNGVLARLSASTTRQTMDTKMEMDMMEMNHD